MLTTTSSTTTRTMHRPEDERASAGSWISQRRDKVVDALLVGAVLTLFVLGIKAFIRDAVKDLSSVQSPKGTMIPVERDPTTRLAFTQEY